MANVRVIMCGKNRNIFGIYSRNRQLGIQKTVLAAMFCLNGFDVCAAYCCKRPQKIVWSGVGGVTSDGKLGKQPFQFLTRKVEVEFAVECCRNLSCFF